MSDSQGPSKKRRREDREDGEVADKASGPASRRPAAAPASTHTWSFPTKGQLPPQWRRIFDEAAEDGDNIPPPTCLTKFVEIHAECLSDFRTSQTMLQKALLTLTKHEQYSSNGAIPTTVSNNLKLPHIQLVKGSPEAGDDADVSAEKEKAEKAIAAASTIVTSYLGKLYAHQVQLCRERVNIASMATAFSVRLQAYGKPIIMAGGGEDDTAWDAVIATLTKAFSAELLSLNFEFVAVLDRDAEAKESKASAVITARADAEMADGTKPVKDLVKEANAKSKLEQKLVKMLNNRLPTPAEAPSSSKAVPSKPAASSSKTKKDAVPKDKAKETKQSAPISKRAKKKARLTAASNGTAAAHKSAGGRSAGKKKARQKDESSNDESD
ncbi:hypothetical protein C8R44DRAFT_865250 [Mycena epipterygia]|nr:hypothetical protein C8R44DRAFT_865250 [Mycena epipterygia]